MESGGQNYCHNEAVKLSVCFFQKFPICHMAGVQCVRCQQLNRHVLSNVSSGIMISTSCSQSSLTFDQPRNQLKGHILHS